MSKAYLVMAEDEYIVGYAKAETPGKARQIAFNNGVVDGYEYINMRSLRCPILDDYDFNFIDATDLLDHDEDHLKSLNLIERATDEICYLLDIEQGDFLFSAKPIKNTNIDGG